MNIAISLSLVNSQLGAQFILSIFIQGGTHSTLHTRQSSIQNNKYQVSQKHSYFSWWRKHSRPKHVEIDKYAKNKLCIKLALFTRYTGMRGQQNINKVSLFKYKIIYMHQQLSGYKTASHLIERRPVAPRNFEIL